MFYCLWKAHVEQIPHKFSSFHGMFSFCAVKTYVENIPWKPGFKWKRFNKEAVRVHHRDYNIQELYGPGHAKRVLCHMRTTKAQISLRIRAVWSAPLFFAAWIV